MSCERVAVNNPSLWNSRVVSMFLSILQP